MLLKMKIKVMLLLAFGFMGLNAFAQQTEKASLSNAAPVLAADTVQAVVASTKEIKTVQPFVKKASFSLSAGTMFGSNGMATYLAPALRYQLSPKFSVFGGVTYLNSSFTPMYAEKQMPMASKNYFVHGGGSYQVNDKLRLSGSVWRDFSSTGNAFIPGGLKSPARYGTEFQAHYKISEHLSVFGSIRTSNGNGYGYDPLNANPSNFFNHSPQLGF
jgi:hypothetical protein